MSIHRQAMMAALDRRVSAWTNGAATFVAMLWLGNWVATHLEPDHGLGFLVIIGVFLVSTLPVRGSRRG